MQHDWLIDVLTDLKAFAEANGMGASATAIDDATLVMLAEMTSLSHRADQAGSAVGDHDGQTGSVTYLFAGRGHA